MLIIFSFSVFIGKVEIYSRSIKEADALKVTVALNRQSLHRGVVMEFVRDSSSSHIGRKGFH